MTESAVRKEDTMEKIRALSKAQLPQSEFDIRRYHFITETGTFTAYLDLKIWESVAWNASSHSRKAGKSLPVRFQRRII